MDSQILSVWGNSLMQEALSALSISSFLDRRYSLRSKSVVTAESSSTVAWRVNAARDDLVVEVKAAAEVEQATKYRANFDMETMFKVCY